MRDSTPTAAFSGPHVKVISRDQLAARRAVPGTSSVTSSGLAGPGNRGAGAGMGIPAYGTGGTHGDGDHMISPGSAGGSATKGAPVGPGGLYDARGAEKPAPGISGRSGVRPAPDPPWWPYVVAGAEHGTRQARRKKGSEKVMAKRNGKAAGGESGATANGAGTGVGGGMGGFDHLGVAPETDADHLALVDSVAAELRGLGERLGEHIELLEGDVNMDPSIMIPLYDAVIQIVGAAENVHTHAVDYNTKYEGIREAMQSSGGKVPGFDPNSHYWD